MRISAGIVADGDKDRDSAGDNQHGNAKALRNDPELIQPGTLDTDFLTLLFVRDHTARNTAGDPAPIRKDHAAEKNKPSSARTETGTERKQVTPGGHTTQYKPDTATTTPER
jgi:hypothetical protein